jgi:hypothetical protein
MKTAHKCFLNLAIGTVLALFAGCASTPETTSAPQGGKYVRNPHLDNVWLADSFDFSGYDTLYLAETKVDSSVKPHDDEKSPMEEARRGLRTQLVQALNDKKLVQLVVTDESQIKPGAKVLRMENTIIEYAKGGGGARYWIGLYGGGQPVIRVRGRVMDADKPVFSFEGRRSGVSAGARLVGAFKTDVEIQSEDIASLVKDLSDFMEQTARPQPAK